MKEHSCRICDRPLQHTFADLGMSPLANSYLEDKDLQGVERFYPLHVMVCDGCFLVQLPTTVDPDEIFCDYAYFSSYSTSWLEHARRFVEMMVRRFELDLEKQVIEIASNDGYLLQYFRQKGISVLGIEPAANIASVAQKAGIPTEVRFFDQAMSQEMVRNGVMADLLIGNNVLAHVPDLREFVSAMNAVLHHDGILTMEFPHLLRLMNGMQFDTIYHEHFSYLSLIAMQKLFGDRGLTIFDVEELPTHGGSLRIFVKHTTNTQLPLSPRVQALQRKEIAAGLADINTYKAFAGKILQLRAKLTDFLLQKKSQGFSIAGYGAPAKGNTLLNHCGIRSDVLDYTVDQSPYKQDHFLPGTHIPIHHPSKIEETKPDYLLILPWNIKSEIMEQMDYIRHWGGQFVIPIPEPMVVG